MAHLPPSSFPETNLLNSSTGNLPLSLKYSGRKPSIVYLFVLFMKRHVEKDVFSLDMEKVNLSPPEFDVILCPIVGVIGGEDISVELFPDIGDGEMAIFLLL